MFSSIKPGEPFYSKKFLDALLELDLQTSNPKLYPNSLDTLLLKTEEDKLIPVGNKDYVDYRSISDRKRDIADILIESDYKGVIIDSIKFDEVQALQESIVGSNLSVKLLKGDISVLLEIPETYEEYLSNLSKKNRHELKRKLKKFQREFPEYEISFGSNEDHLATFIDLHRNSSKEKEEFMTDEVESFFAHLLKIKGWKVYILWVDKEAVAACFCFENKEALYLYNSGINRDFDGFSVGIFLTHYLISKSISEKKKIFDFLKGLERYKFDLGGKPEQLYNIELKKV